MEVANGEDRLDARTAVLLVNLGTPASPSTRDVRKYLREFLSDERVIDSHPLVRALLLNLVILPFRPRRSAAAYRMIWTEAGSPLLVESEALARDVARNLGDGFHVVLAMRYGEPSLSRALDELLGAKPERLVIVPLFPQYAEASTGSALARIEELLPKDTAPEIASVPAFYDDPGFLSAWAAVASERLEAFRPDHVLLSYHGLPERQVKRTDESGTHCLASPECCDKISAVNRNCYRAQCQATSKSLVRALGLENGQWSMAFQSRLGRTPWIQPFTDQWVAELAAQGHKRLAVLCPAFVADCLETVEEIGIRLAFQWRELGGEDLMLVPSLNAHPAWTQAVVNLIQAHTFAHP